MKGNKAAHLRKADKEQQDTFAQNPCNITHTSAVKSQLRKASYGPSSGIPSLWYRNPISAAFGMCITRVPSGARVQETDW